MLCQYSFQNYKSFKNEAFLDFMAEQIKDNQESIIIDKIDGERFLPVISIYGPNGGGKSTVLESLNFLRTFILQKIIPYRVDSNDENDFRSRFVKMILNSNLKEKYFKFDPKCKDEPTSFDILFRISNREYRYQLSMIHNEIVEENLYMQPIGKEPKIVFERSSDDCYLGDIFTGIEVNKLRNSMPLLSHLAITYDIAEIDDVVSWFQDINFVDYDAPSKDQRIVIPKPQNKQKALFNLLREMDIDITGFRVEKDSDGNIIELYTKHTLPNGKSFEIPFEDESSGTRKLFSCLADLLDSLTEGQLVVADELDAKLHPKLLQCIIKLFTDPKINKKGAQLLLTSHDITTMNSSVYRRDEIWFCALNPDHVSKLYSLIAFRKKNGLPPRNDETYWKQYLEGRYGADPYIRRILDWEEINK